MEEGLFKSYQKKQSMQELDGEIPRRKPKREKKRPYSWEGRWRKKREIKGKEARAGPR